jgi:sulfofructose kinase
MVSVLCVGIATLDYVYAVPALPISAAKHRATALEVVGGGIAANAAVAVARLGGKALLATRLGDDATGDVIRAELGFEGVDCALSVPEAGRRSPVSAIMVDVAGERMVVSYADPGMPNEPAWLPATLPADTAAVLGDTRWEAGAVHLFKLARAAGILAVLDADRKPASQELLALATHVAFSEQGLTELTGIDEAQAALRSLGTQQSWHAVTCGDRGVHIWHAGKGSHVPAFVVATVDTLGAGDIWHGAFALALGEGKSEQAAVMFANAAAAIKCTRFGGRKGAPTRIELEQFLGECP